MWRFLNSIPRALKNYHGPRASVGVYVESDDKEKDQQDSPVIVNTEKESHNNNVVALTRNESSFCPFKHANVRGTTILWRLAGVRHPTRRLSGSAVDEQEDDRQPQSHRGGEGEEGSLSLSSSQHHWWGIAHKDLKYFFHGYNRILEALAAGSHYLWSPYKKKGQTYDLVYRVLFSIHGKETIVKSIRDQEGGDGEEEEGVRVTAQLPPSVGQTLLAIKDASGSEHDRLVNELKCDSLDAALKEFEHMCTDYSSQNESLLGIVAADSGDMSEAVRHFQVACALGNKTACFNVGLCFETGNGVVKNVDKAKHYYELAARKGHMQAMYNLSLLYLSDGEQPSVGDRREGLEWMGMAAKAGLVQAQTYMGVHYMEEEGDPKKAVTYFRAAARQNDKEGQYFLALCHEHGLGVEVNECWAAHLYSLAASGGHDEAICCLARFTEQGLGGLPVDAHAAMDLYSRAAHFGNEEAKTRLEQLIKLEEEKAKMTAVNRMKHDQVSSSRTRLSRSSPGGDKKRSSLSSSSSTPSLTAPRPQSNDSGGNSGVSLSLTGMMYQRLWEFYQTCADTKRQFLFDHGGGNGDGGRISFQIGDDVDDRSLIGGHTTALDTARSVNTRDTLLLQRTSCDCSHPPLQHLQQLQKSHTTPDLSSMVACNI